MLSERHTQLVIDYVDGTLDARRRKTVLKLLHKSAKARKLLEQLQANVELLRSLPKHKLDPQFATKLVNEIKARGLEQMPGHVLESVSVPSPVAARRAFPTWAGVAVAAAVLAMVSFGSYVFFVNLGDDTDSNTPIVEIPKIVPPEPTRLDPLVHDLIAGAHQGYQSPIGLQIAGADLAKPTTQTLLAKELVTRTSFHVDVASRANGRAVQQLIKALEIAKAKVFVDDKARPELLNNNPRVEYLVYAENLSATEVNSILRQLGDDATPDDVQSVQLSPLTDGHRSALSRILGVEEKKLQAPPGKPMELLNPIEVPKNGKKNGGPAPKVNGQPAAEPMALVMVLEAGASRSEQIRRFVDSRKTLRPGSLQVVMVVHS